MTRHTSTNETMTIVTASTSRTASEQRTRQTTTNRLSIHVLLSSFSWYSSANHIFKFDKTPLIQRPLGWLPLRRPYAWQRVVLTTKEDAPIETPIAQYK